MSLWKQLPLVNIMSYSENSCRVNQNSRPSQYFVIILVNVLGLHSHNSIIGIDTWVVQKFYWMRFIISFKFNLNVLIVKLEF